MRRRTPQRLAKWPLSYEDRWNVGIFTIGRVAQAYASRASCAAAVLHLILHPMILIASRVTKDIRLALLVKTVYAKVLLPLTPQEHAVHIVAAVATAGVAHPGWSNSVNFFFLGPESDLVVVMDMVYPLALSALIKHPQII
ncbi:hypothetical protein EVAR_92695_1 [Eumeta japonica]|uniref:Uncharacterized protein n=1 Tax=Eumeta variegata TaxID=151549 RepID=A0A4C1SZZ7_EUMVA|nr:hypothetical protein EVAR_92695_1 [Eumeta japonica]